MNYNLPATYERTKLWILEDQATFYDLALYSPFTRGDGILQTHRRTRMWRRLKECRVCVLDHRLLEQISRSGSRSQWFERRSQISDSTDSKEVLITARCDLASKAVIDVVQSCEYSGPSVAQWLQKTTSPLAVWNCIIVMWISVQ